MMMPGRLVCVVLTVLVLLAAGCGGGENGTSGGGGGGDTGGGDTGGGDTGGGDTGGGGDDDELGFTLNTTLDLGQAFGEEPMFDGELGLVTVNVRTDRAGGANAQIPITFRLVNSGQENLEEVATTIHFTVLAGTDPEDPPVPGPDDPALELSPQTTAGTCAAEDTTSSSATIACTLGTLASGAEATITVTSPRWFKLSIEMELTALGP